MNFFDGALKSSEKLQNELKDVIKRLNAPFYFYHLDGLKTHLESINSYLDPDIKLWYACKANPASAILKVLRNLNFGVDVASKGELFQVLNTGIKGKNIIATGPGKSKDYLAHLVESGVETIVLESLNQALWLNEVAIEKNIKVKCLIRVQLTWDSSNESVLGGNEITPFGIDSSEWESFQVKSYPGLDILGFHAFQWGNILEPSALETIWEKTLTEITALSEKINIPIRVVDLGGGLGIPYHESQKRIEFKQVHDILVKLKSKYKLQKIWMELGRFTVGEIGHYFTPVTDIKKVRGKKLVVVEGGINHMARVALTGESFPVSSYTKTGETEPTQIHGPLCTALDKLGEFELPKDLAPGDWLVFHQVGAYGFTESMPYFLCHSLAGEVFYYNGDMMIPRPPRESYEWMI